MTCALCGMSLTDGNKSREHVFPNALGGRKTVRKFICVKCNSNTGSDWDDELVRQLRPLCTMLDVNRARGRNRRFAVETLGDRKLALNPDGSMTIAEPVFETRERDGRTEVTMRARNMREMRRMVSGLKKKHPEIDVEKVMKRAEPTQEYSREPYAVSLNVGGLLAGRSIVKFGSTRRANLGTSLVPWTAATRGSSQRRRLHRHRRMKIRRQKPQPKHQIASPRPKPGEDSVAACRSERRTRRSARQSRANPPA